MDPAPHPAAIPGCSEPSAHGDRRDSSCGSSDAAGAVACDDADADADKDAQLSALRHALATRRDDAAAVRLIERGGARLARAQLRGGGGTPLHWACEAGSAPAFEALLRAGADPLAAAPAGAGLLHACASAGLVPLLARPGAPLEARDAAGGTPRHAAAARVRRQLRRRRRQGRRWREGRRRGAAGEMAALSRARGGGGGGGGGMAAAAGGQSGVSADPASQERQQQQRFSGARPRLRLRLRRGGWLLWLRWWPGGGAAGQRRRAAEQRRWEELAQREGGVERRERELSGRREAAL
ncbi:hypothetical protein Rsub_11579 [Raphidocelis subcapitata]|uniref:Uncharacterized protein n=1 Tax=Raphidocelis subcapitata TaxID=307507 RepID=A0A2V0PG39_9CHLO|nr:hypothetical protein Rsub_11579 [Raphidocelis subcapitata]|eukprot:GBF98814.1 hypothetical protein Rsub_11579 [Raphidocelis subcapitata]